jgi:hypothetical protein
MDRKKLQLDTLDVTTFDVTPAFAISTGSLQLGTIVKNPNDPTNATFCYHCDDTVHNCPNQTILALG